MRLQDALAEADSGDEIRVAQGTYTPTAPGGSREAAFHLLADIAVNGGYAGWGAADSDARDVLAFRTVLSGDLNADDQPSFVNRSDNCYHVVTGGGAAAVLDGVTIAGGNADGEWPYPASFGGGLYMFTGTVSRCSIRDNAATDGGGVYQSKANFFQCLITDNVAFRRGGGASFDGISPTFAACVFRNNVATPDNPDGCGGGMFTLDNSPDLFNCAFVGNLARAGGALYTMENYGSEIVNCTFAGNQAVEAGAGLYNEGPGIADTPFVTNCVFWANAVGGQTDLAAQLAGEMPTVSHSCIQGLTAALDGAGNIGDAPRFVDADGPDNVFGTADDNLRLLPDSPCINTGDNGAIPPGVTEDLDANPRIVKQVVDMGAYESFAPACVWDGDGANNQWSTAGNWIGNSAPGPGDDLIFPGGGGFVVSVNDYPAGTQFGEIRFCGGVTAVTTPIYAMTVNVEAGRLTTARIVANTLTIGAEAKLQIATDDGASASGTSVVNFLSIADAVGGFRWSPEDAAVTPAAAGKIDQLASFAAAPPAIQSGSVPGTGLDGVDLSWVRADAFGAAYLEIRSARVTSGCSKALEMAAFLDALLPANQLAWKLAGLEDAISELAPMRKGLRNWYLQQTHQLWRTPAALVALR